MAKSVHALIGKKYYLARKDCVAFLSGLDEGSVDFVFADPPYGISNLRNVSNSWNGYSSSKGEWDVVPLGPWVQGACRALRPGGIIVVSGVFGSLIPVWNALCSYGMKFLSHPVWYKTNPVPSIHRRCFTNANELLLVFAKPGRRYTFNYDMAKVLNGGKQMHNVFRLPSARKLGGIISKPEQLVKILVEVFSNVGDVICDPFLGTGTTAVVALRLKRKFIGCDISKIALKVSQRRLREAGVA